MDLQFAAAILQKRYVGFYLICIYMNEPVKKKISPALLKLLEGKTCFQLKQLDDSLLKDIAAAVAAGAQYYREGGWVEGLPSGVRSGDLGCNYGAGGDAI